ncbi:MAG TPA: alkaline phosphatase family protein [Anaerolineae bacterium]|nr:alkaline phosphatase family protein [Anaerolineae bacterium]
MKVFVIGIDCGEPSLVFERWRDRLPNLSRLMEAGTYGELTSTIPAITVPAWASMLSSKDPGQLGFYGFRNRADHSYERMSIASARSIKVPRVWNLLSAAGKKVVVAGVPQTYPVEPVNGALISSFLTPSTQSQYTHPPELKAEIEGLLDGEYMFDVPQFRTENKDHLLAQIYQMAERQHTVVKHLMTSIPWDFFMHVDMGVDRMHHGFWKFYDPRHPKYEPGNPYENAIRDYYVHLDAQIGERLALLDDETAVLVVSDHGAKPMVGGICFNEWLKQEGYLVLEHQPAGIVPLEKCEVDWSRTRAWGSGGYYARLFLNVKGREPEGIIEPEDYERVRDELIERIAAIADPDGKVIGSVAYKPEEIYRQVNNIAPDLIVYFGNLSWRSLGSLGTGRVHTFENDTGPDDANHAQEGLYIYYHPHRASQGPGPRRHLMDVAPTLLDLVGVDVPADMRGSSFA